MKRSGRAAAALAVALTVVGPAHADDDFGSDEDALRPLIITLSVTSALGTVVTGIGSAVFAARGEALSTPWLVAALFSGGLTMGTGVSLLTFDGDIAPPIGAVLIALASWPLGYSVRSALNPDGFGAPLGSRLLPPPGAEAMVPLVTLEL